ncbi:unnamed protein product [Cuscuta epithymum]|uniref:Vesicle transport protein n=1 Tax=Cuscuta epithymum TaxID=186058 RepID=A0AAV0FZ27_9ASTE|nr:unnamed protein product [Cuscuta epithymum]
MAYVSRRVSGILCAILCVMGVAGICLGMAGGFISWLSEDDSSMRSKCRAIFPCVISGTILVAVAGFISIIAYFYCCKDFTRRANVFLCIAYAVGFGLVVVMFSKSSQLSGIINVGAIIVAGICLLWATVYICRSTSFSTIANNFASRFTGI